MEKLSSFHAFFFINFSFFSYYHYLCTRNRRSDHAQMAELVDALVSNTNAARRAGSIPALGTFITLVVIRQVLRAWRLLL